MSPGRRPVLLVPAAAALSGTGNVGGRRYREI
jgi:hypothetical protein